MENASKAIIMAGAVMLAVAIISLSLYAYSSYREYARSSEQIYSVTQISSFNRFYESYKQGNGTIREIDKVNIYNKAVDDGLISGSYESLVIENALEYRNYHISYDSQGRVSGVSF